MQCSKNSRWGVPSPRGFTLIEMMITVAIIAILAAIAYPSYVEQLAKGRRADARARLMAAQQWMERYYTERYSYTSSGDHTKNLDFEKQATLVVSPPPGEGAVMYNISVAATPSNYTLKATRDASSVMKNDPCGDLSINKVGTKSVQNYDTKRFGSLEAAVAGCWK